MCPSQFGIDVLSRDDVDYPVVLVRRVRKRRSSMKQMLQRWASVTRGFQSSTITNSEAVKVCESIYRNARLKIEIGLW